MDLRKSSAFLLWALLLAGCCAAYYAGMLTRLPFGLHAWAQADRLSPAICYHDNGMNFFLPATLNQASVRGITGIELPIQSYIAAACGFVFGRSHIPLCFRLLDILLAVAGLHALFLIVYRRTGHFILSVLTPLTIFTAPVFVYYAGNFLPDPAAASVAFIGFYFLFDFLEHPLLNKKLYAALCLFTLAALIKTSAGIYLIAAVVTAFFSLRQMNTGKREMRRFIILSTLLLCLPVAQYGYIRWLNETYHSILFLAKPIPLIHGRDMQDFFAALLHKWTWDYATLPQYVCLLAWMIFGRKTLGSVPVHHGHRLYLRLCLAGALAMLFLFGGQYDVHDYYVIAPWYPLLAYALLVAVCRLYKSSFFTKNSLRISAVMMAALTLFFAAGYAQIYQRLHDETRFLTAHDPVLWMRNGADFLQKAGVPQDEQIMVLGDDSPNISLIYFDRKGFTEMNPAPAIARMRERKIRLLVCSTATLQQLQKKQDKMLPQLHVLAIENGKAALIMAAQ